MRRITGRLTNRLVLALVVVGLLPLSLYGLLSLSLAHSTARISIEDGLREVAIRSAGQIDLYVGNCLRILEALRENLLQLHLEPWQLDGILNNYTLRLREFSRLTLVDSAGQAIAGTPRADAAETPTEKESLRSALAGKRLLGEPYLTPELTPAIEASFPVTLMGEVKAALLARIDLVDLWTLVGSIRLGKTGYASVVTAEGKLIAHGNPNELALLLRGENPPESKIAGAVRRTGKPQTGSYPDGKGARVVAAAAPIPSVGWVLVLEQSAGEAYALDRRMTLFLLAGIVVTLGSVAVLGLLLGRRQILRPVRSLLAGTREIGAGNLDARVDPAGGDEFEEVGRAFNWMGGELKKMQERIRRQERMATVASFASGLVHDLRAPFQNLRRLSRLLLAARDDPEASTTVEKGFERELENVDRFFENLRNIAGRTKLALQPVPFAATAEGVLDLCRDLAMSLGVEVVCSCSSPDLSVRADRFALERILRNLVRNALEAMPQGGKLSVSAEADPSDPAFVLIRVADTGAGIPPERLQTLFEELTTTKRKGFGLGLAVSHRLASEMSGRLEVRSEVGVGSEFILHLRLDSGAIPVQIPDETGRPV